MARHIFASDLFLYEGGGNTVLLGVDAPFRVWTARTGGTDVTTSMTDIDGVTPLPTNGNGEILADGNGIRPWMMGPDTLSGVEVDIIYIEATGGVERHPVESSDNFIGQSGWDQDHPTFGPYHMWIDGTGELRMKNGAPTSDTDGGFVGGGASPLTVQEADGTPTVPSVTLLKVSDGTLTDDGAGTVTVSTGVAGSFVEDPSNSGFYMPAPATSLTGSVTYDPPSLATGLAANTTVTVTGAAVGDTVVATHSSVETAATSWVLTGYVSAVNTVRVVLLNVTGGTVDLGSGTLRVRVFKQ